MTKPKPLHLHKKKGQPKKPPTKLKRIPVDMEEEIDKLIEERKKGLPPSR